MNAVRPDKDQDILCCCSGTTRTRIKELIAEGIADLEVLSARTGAGSGCGSCEPLMRELIAEHG